jgi:hypothetical protein
MMDLRNSRNEQTDNGTNIEHVNQDTELVGICNLRKVLFPKVHLLRSIDEHSISS